MSCFVCDEKTISVLAKAIADAKLLRYHTCNNLPDYENPEDIARWLWKQNRQAYCDRYGEVYQNKLSNVFHYKPNLKCDLGTVYGCLCCYQYQVSDLNDYGRSPVRDVLAGLKSHLLREALKALHLSAPYGYDGHNIF